MIKPRLFFPPIESYIKIWKFRMGFKIGDGESLGDLAYDYVHFFIEWNSKTIAKFRCYQPKSLRNDYNYGFSKGIVEVTSIVNRHISKEASEITNEDIENMVKEVTELNDKVKEL